MSKPENLSRDDWEALLQAPFGAYSTVASAEEAATAAQFRCLREELETAAGAFAPGTTGRMLAGSVTANLEVLWAAHQAARRSPEDVIKRAVKGLRRVPARESEAVRDWLATLAVRVAQADRVVGEPSVSWDELDAIRALARWLRRPVPDIGSG
jgi:hypothetical protein